MEISTKQKILDAALTLFSEKGYESVSVGEIAGAVGIKAPSLYKHYKSKQEIFDSILIEMNQRYKKQAESMNLNGFDAEIDAKAYENISEDIMISMGKGLFLYFMHDEYTCKFRKMLTVEQYHNRELAQLFSKQYMDDVLEYQSMVLGMLSSAGVLKQENPQIMALHFYAPMYMLLTVCDRQPEREQQSLEILEQHIRQFNRIYKRNEDNEYNSACQQS